MKLKKCHNVFTANAIKPGGDAERGEGAAAPGASAGPGACPGAGAGAARGKWGRLLAGGSLDAPDAPRAAFTRSLSARDRAPPDSPAPAPAPALASVSLKVHI